MTAKTRVTHTPGPWRISSRPAQLVSTDGQVIALAIGYDSENLQENARLIAAAPEMYAFLKNVIPKGSIYEPEIEALIAKVEGREP